MDEIYNIPSTPIGQEHSVPDINQSKAKYLLQPPLQPHKPIKRILREQRQKKQAATQRIDFGQEDSDADLPDEEDKDEFLDSVTDNDDDYIDKEFGGLLVEESPTTPKRNIVVRGGKGKRAVSEIESPQQERTPKASLQAIRKYIPTLYF